MVDTLSKLDLQDFFRDVAQARQSALLLDYDGTLAPFRQNRHEALPYPGVTGLLNGILATGRTRLVLITGRCAQELIPLLDIFPHPEIWERTDWSGCIAMVHTRCSPWTRTPLTRSPPPTSGSIV